MARSGSCTAPSARGIVSSIDAIVGTGFKPPLHGLARKAVASITDAAGTIVSVDVPSGIDADSKTPVHESGGNMVFAHGIIALIAPKPAHAFGELTSGPIAVSEIGTQPAFVPNETGVDVITGQDVGITFPPRSNDAHKDQFGHVLVIAGSLGKAGETTASTFAISGYAGPDGDQAGLGAAPPGVGHEHLAGPVPAAGVPLHEPVALQRHEQARRRALGQPRGGCQLGERERTRAVHDLYQ